MSKVLIINSGLKHTDSYLEPYIKRLNVFLKKRQAVVDIRDILSFDERTFFSYDQIIFVFMNTLESIPSTMLEVFYKLETQKKDHQEVYAMIICDEYEPEKCDHSKKIIKKWCEKEGLQFKGSFHLGSGLIIMKSFRKYGAVAQIEKFATQICKHQEVNMSFTLFSLNSFIKMGNYYWQSEMNKKKKELKKMNQE